MLPGQRVERINHKISHMGWYKWEPLGNQIIGSPGAFSMKNNHVEQGRMDIFARGTDNQLWQKVWQGAGWDGKDWHRPDNENFTLDSSPVVASSGEDLQVYVRGVDGQVWRKVWRIFRNSSIGGEWLPWEPLGGIIQDAPGVGNFGRDSMDIFARGTDNQLWLKQWWLYTWSTWEKNNNETFNITSSPAVTSNGVDLEFVGPFHQVYVRGADRQVWRKVYGGRTQYTEGTWSEWEPLGGQIIGGPTVFSLSDTHVDIFARGTDFQLWQKAWRTDHWIDWHKPDNEEFFLWSSPVVASTGADLQVYARGSDGQVWRKVWVP